MNTENTMSSNETTEEQSGGRRIKNKSLKKHKVNNVLRAWRMHVQNVAKSEGISYGKEAMQLAKKGKHGQEWSSIKMSLKKQKGGEGGESSSMSHENAAMNMVAESAESAEGSIGGSPLTSSSSSSSMPTPPTYQGGARRKTRRHNRKTARKSRKHRRSRKH